MIKKTLLTGVQPTNSLTLGNYLGAIKKIVDLQNDFETIIFVADLHARTIPLHLHNFTFKKLNENSKNIIKMYIACGIDLKKTKIFIQSEISEHLELFYFLLTHSVVGELKRMTQYKFLSQQFKEPNGTEMALTGLLVYPILMASDILLYDADFVAVGQDQTQHLELTKDIAFRINEKYKKEIFKIPEIFNDKNYSGEEKIMDLQDPTKKMSKSNKNEQGTIFLNDDESSIKEKIMKTKTDSINKINLDKENQPGIYNLLNIYSLIKNISIMKVFEEFKDLTYLDLKKTLAEVICQELKIIQEKYKLTNVKKAIEEISKQKDFCQKIARKKLDEIYEKI